jgi:hypothetical protein
MLSGTFPNPLNLSLAPAAKKYLFDHTDVPSDCSSITAYPSEDPRFESVYEKSTD